MIYETKKDMPIFKEKIESPITERMFLTKNFGVFGYGSGVPSTHCNNRKVSYQVNLARPKFP